MTKKAKEEALDYEKLMETSMKYAVDKLESMIFNCHTRKYCSSCGTVCPFNIRMFGDACLKAIGR